jgi:hypothetical protein
MQYLTDRFRYEKARPKNESANNKDAEQKDEKA